jgi:hypothetical protein
MQPLPRMHSALCACVVIGILLVASLQHANPGLQVCWRVLLRLLFGGRRRSMPQAKQRQHEQQRNNDAACWEGAWQGA